MEGTYRDKPYLNDQDDPEYTPENMEDSPKKRRALEKRVVFVPIKDVEGSRVKGETPPPSDSWTWRKYGQKPIKGSPYPRGYYKCSSSKGCPARKQVERSRADPTMLVVTYSCEHNHTYPTLKNNNSSNNNNNNIADKVIDEPATATTSTTEVASVSVNSTTSSDDDLVVFENQFLAEEPLVNTYEFKWFSDLVPTSTMNESLIKDNSGTGRSSDSDEAVIFPMREEDESLFADLGELPECALVFRRWVLCGTSA